MSPFLISFIEKKKCKPITILNPQEYTTWTPLPTITKQRTVKLQHLSPKNNNMHYKNSSGKTFALNSISLKRLATNRTVHALKTLGTNSNVSQKWFG